MASVETLINAAQAYAEETVQSASDALSQMQLAINNIGYASVTYTGTNLPQAPTLQELIDAPVLDPVNLTIPTEPGAAPEFQAISRIELGVIPEFTGTAPTLNLPSLPSQLGEFNQTAPEITTSFVFPTTPAALDVEILAPTLMAHVMPSAPSISLPSFDAVAPAAVGNAPTDLSGQYVAAYRELSPQFVAALEERMDASIVRFNPQFHSQLEAINNKLATYVAGGTGLSPAIEDAIYERAKDKGNADYLRTERAAMDSAASRGFTMPDGMAFAAIQNARQAKSDNLARAANEIAIAQAEREQENLKWAVGQVANLSNAALSASLAYFQGLININGQALQGAQSMVANVVESYNVQLRVFEANHEAYRTEGAIFEVRLKAGLSDLERYRAELDGVQKEVDIDQSKVAIYRAQIQAQESLNGIYKTRVETVVSQASLEKLKIDLYRTQAEAFSVRARIKELEYRAFEALMSGNEQQVKIYSTQLDAHNSRLRGLEIQANTQTEVVRAQVLANDGVSNNYRSQLAAFGSIVDARSKVASAQIQNNAQYLDAWKAQNAAQVANAELGVTVYRAQAQIIIENAKLELESLLKAADQRTQYSKSIAEVGIGSAKVYEAMASAALSSQNTLVGQTLQE